MTICFGAGAGAGASTATGAGSGVEDSPPPHAVASSAAAIRVRAVMGFMSGSKGEGQQRRHARQHQRQEEGVEAGHRWLRVRRVDGAILGVPKFVVKKNLGAANLQRAKKPA